MSDNQSALVLHSPTEFVIVLFAHGDHQGERNNLKNDEEDHETAADERQ